jgi:hypothetical protein
MAVKTLSAVPANAFTVPATEVAALSMEVLFGMEITQARLTNAKTINPANMERALRFIIDLLYTQQANKTHLLLLYKDLKFLQHENILFSKNILCDIRIKMLGFLK